ncbi:hypothetical protein BGZ70_002846 [Mortierella alpina]|uniref:AAA+ ATPase domain-containing protein n=1 Tax=Mortierella alpina TaxID=64518 RepID=A0A9P6M5F3_MORAP|nr:hypothetical protein BGZ70_002846 [Mortierella alpina]
MLALIRATSARPRPRTGAVRSLCSATVQPRVLVRPAPAGATLRSPRSSRALHTPPPSLFKNNAAASSEATPSSPSAPSSPSSSGPTSTPPGDSNSSPAKDTPANASDNGGKASSAVESTASRQPAAPSIKRRLKSHRGSGRATARAHLSTDPTSKVYVPVIPEWFLNGHYHLAAHNTCSLSGIPYHIHDGVMTELINTVASCLLAPSGPQAHLQRMPARHNNIILSSPAEGSARMLETLAMAAAKRVGADIITIDVQDLMELTPDMFNVKGVVGNPWPADHLARGFNPFVAAPVPEEFVEDLDDDSSDDFDDDDMDADEEPEGRGRGTIFVDSRVFASKLRHGRQSSGSTATSLKEKFERFWTALLLAEPASTVAMPAAPSSTSSRSPVRPKTQPKILFFNDLADIIHTGLGTVAVSALSNAVLTLRKAGHNVMVVAGHSPSLISLKPRDDDDLTETRGDSGTVSIDGESGADVPLVTILQKLRSPAEDSSSRGNHQYPHTSALSNLVQEKFPGPTQLFHHISIPPYLPIPSDSASGVLLSTETSLRKQYALENACLLQKDKADRIKEVNCRNLHAVARFRGAALSESDTAATVFGSLQGISSEIWGFSKVYRVISSALGELYLSDKDKHGAITGRSTLSEDHVQSALDTSLANTKLRKIVAGSDWSGKSKTEATKPLVRIEDCDRYESKLFGSIVDPAKLKTTFKNTITPAETVHTLQTMITLPLVRPQLFSYGLLKNEFLSGLLLFGPPGTGKTLLAKAVAKESGARMLEIKASDIFDMYVGEGEKNVSAVFSLARKLSPCVIFLDEVDSIFRARGSGGSGGSSGGGNSSQREILNQFMVEWDGLRSSGQNNGIVIMASTNRPFELDDAVLRRLPRRILVDLPSEQARERILNVYLSEEVLEEGVDVKDLAKKTTLFSGSDLKNLCVSAALAAVREEVENEVKSLHFAADVPADSFSSNKDKDSGKEQDKVFDLSPLLRQYKQDALKRLGAGETQTALLNSPMEPPAKRVIAKRHFDKALAQITPSCSENMESLTELRKWDGLYGDGGKGRRKAIKGLGFEAEPALTATTSSSK